MAINLDISGDYAIFDNVESVTLTSQDGATTTSGLSAIKEGQRIDSANQGGVNVPLVRTTWHLFVGQLGTTRPERHGYITDSNGTQHYVDDEPELLSWDTRWQCRTTAEAGANITKRAS